jgi:hypothetical protein
MCGGRAETGRLGDWETETMSGSGARGQVRATVPVTVLSGGGAGIGVAPCIEFVASSGIIDRYGEVIEPLG